MRKIDYLLIGNSRECKARCEDIASEYGYTFRQIQSIDDLADHEAELKNTNFILLMADHINDQGQIAGMVQVLKQICPDSYSVICIDSKLDPSVASFIRKSGANLVISTTDIYETSKLEYATSQKINSTFLPVKVEELQANTTIGCSLYHSLPLNRKFLPVITANTIITEDRLKKLVEVKHIYIKRSDVEAFQKYCDVLSDDKTKSTTRNIRSRLLSLNCSYSDLVLNMIDQSEKVSYAKGNDLYLQTSRLADDLIQTLQDEKNVWELIQESASGTLGSLDRAPTITAYAGYLSFKSKQGDSHKTMIAAMVCDFGWLDFPPALTKAIRHKVDFDTWPKDHQKIFHHHPLNGLNNALARKFQLTEDIKEIILKSHETYDRKGYPVCPRPDVIPVESIILQIAALIDEGSFIPMGKKAPPIHFVKDEIFKSFVRPMETYNYVLVDKMRQLLQQ